MPASDSKPAAMEVNRDLKEEKGDLADPPASIPASTFSRLIVGKPSFTTDAIMESKAISVARDECSSALPSPAEASPAKPDVTLSSILEQTFEQSPDTSQTASASDSVKSPGAGLLSITDSLPWVSALPSSTFGCADSAKDLPVVLTFKGVSVTLENNSIWKRFSECGTEMILTKQGRRMFPYCRYRLSGLDPDRMYSLVLSIVPSSQFRYRWSTSKWEVNGPTEHQAQGLIRAFPHHYSPCRGSEWMSCLVSFYKLKLTNYFQDQEGHMILHSMHRYIPRLHIIPVLDGDAPTADKPVVMGPESMTFTFPQTEFMAVTTYQNFRITQLKINHNPFAKGFRDDGNNPRLNRILPAQGKPETQTEVPKPAEPSEQQKEVMDLSAKSPDPSAPPANAQESRLVLKPIMSNPSSNGDAYVPCMRGKHALGEIVLHQNQPAAVPKTEDIVIITPKTISGLRRPRRSRFNQSVSSAGAPARSTLYRRKKRRKIKRRWTICYGRPWRTAAAPPKVTHSPSLTVAMQPELDEIEGLLFVSFTSKEALEVHIKGRLTDASSSEPSATLPEPMETKEMEEFSGVSVEENPEPVDEKTAQLESVLLDDLSALRHRQVIHPVLQEVGLKLSSLDPTKPVDLKYLGVCLPPPPSSLHSQGSALPISPSDEELPFISRTGKTRDVTKIKGWRNKFTRSQEASASAGEGLQKNLSAFCSNMLDEYLESEAQQISERAAAFSAHTEDAVAYQLPASSASYVRTLDSALQRRRAASRVPAGANRPCPLSRKAPPRSARASPAASPTSSEAPSQASEPEAAAGAGYTDDDSQRLPTSQAGAYQRAVTGCGQNQAAAHRAASLTKIQQRLMQMEEAAFHQGLSRTRLTPERLSTALSVIMSNQDVPSQSPFQDCAAGPACGQEFCRLGCVCHSLKQPNASADHCRQPECMFTCSCFKPGVDTEQSAQPRLASHPGKLWNRNIYDEDLEPLYTPRAPPSSTPVNAQKSWTFSPAPPIREEDKDPVYKYLESKLTCARVRGYNSQPPPVVTLSPALFQQQDKPAPPDGSKPVIKQENLAEVADQKPAETPSQEATSIPIKAKKQIQIQSLCPWKSDSKMVLERLCERMKQNRLHRRFYVGPYCVRPVTRVILKKPSGAVVSYRMQISKPDKVSDSECQSEGEEKKEDKLCPGEKEPGSRFGGRLRARKKPPGCKASGLIQVNDKYYNQATLLLGNMGSLHPANRLAAHVTGRLRAEKVSQVQHPTNPTPAPEPHLVKARNTFFPPVLDQKATLQLVTAALQADLPKPPSLSNASSSTAQDSQKPQAVTAAEPPFVPIQQNIHSSSTSSPVSLTVSPSLKSPSFLAESGTYSFRICPPSTQAGQQLPGVALPGGFTLIRLQNPGSDKAGDQAKPANGSDNKPESNLSHLAREWVGFDTFSKVRNLLNNNSSSPDPSSGRLPEEKRPAPPPDGKGEKNSLLQTANQQELRSGMSSEESSSDFSDYDDSEEDDEMVDIETVEVKHGEVISKMRAEASMRSEVLRDFPSAENVREMKEINEPILKYEKPAERKESASRRNHSAVEKLRRCEQRVLFDRLETLLNLETRSSRSHVLALAVKEVENLAKTSRYLQAEKQRLLQAQSVFLKKLSALAGKPESLILSKLKDILERQKQREKNLKWKPVFSHLLQSKAALLEATAPASDLQPTSAPPLPQELDISPPGQASLSEMAKQNLQQLLSLFTTVKRAEKAPGQSAENTSSQDAQPKRVSILVPVQGDAAPPGPQAEAQQGEPGALDRTPSSLENLKASGSPGQSATPASQINSQQLLDKLAVTVAKATAGSSGTKKTTIVVPSRSVALPLIRSKTGRLILPSSLKPFGKGYYTLMVMESKKQGEADEASSSANGKPSVSDPSKSSEETASNSNQPSDPEVEHGATDKSATSASDPKSLSAASPLGDFAFLNKTLCLPPFDQQAAEEKQAATFPILVQMQSGQMCLKPADPVLVSSPKSEQNSRPASVGVGRGRPLESKASRRSAGANKTEAEPPKTVKRGRGRPPGRKTTVKRTRHKDSDDDDTPVKFFIPSVKSPSSPNSKGEAKTSRPQTRGSLGKDFPSAKKRSWIDVEKELGTDLDFV